MKKNLTLAIKTDLLGQLWPTFPKLGLFFRSCSSLVLFSGVPSAATVVIVMCIAALVVVVVLGIYRIHLTHQQEVKLAETAKEADVTWDESALTITVNPMEVGGWRI